MGASRPPSILETKSLAWATSRACHSSSSVASSRPRRRLEATVPANRKGCWGTSPICAHSASGSASRTSVPPMSTCPLLASSSLASSRTTVDLPDAVEPTIAVVVPGWTVKLTSARTRASASG